MRMILAAIAVMALAIANDAAAAPMQPPTGQDVSAILAESGYLQMAQLRGENRRASRPARQRQSVQRQAPGRQAAQRPASRPRAQRAPDTGRSRPAFRQGASPRQGAAPQRRANPPAALAQGARNPRQGAALQRRGNASPALTQGARNPRQSAVPQRRGNPPAAFAQGRGNPRQEAAPRRGANGPAIRGPGNGNNRPFAGGGAGYDRRSAAVRGQRYDRGVNNRSFRNRGPANIRPGYRSRGRSFVYRGYSRPSLYVTPFYYPRGYGYRYWRVGEFLPALFLSAQFYFYDYYSLGVNPPPPGYRWVRYGPDLLLVNLYTNEVVDVVYGAFYW